MRCLGLELMIRQITILDVDRIYPDMYEEYLLIEYVYG